MLSYWFCEKQGRSDSRLGGLENPTSTAEHLPQGDENALSSRMKKALRGHFSQKIRIDTLKQDTCTADKIMECIL